MLKPKVVNDALGKALADKSLTFGYALRLAAEQNGESKDAYSVQYIRFMDSLGSVTLLNSGTDYCWLHSKFLDFLQQENLLEPPAPVAGYKPYKPDEFDFSDWESIKKSVGF